MKKQILFLSTVIFCVLSAFAQTPYDNFAPEQSVKSMIELPQMQFEIVNTDPNSEICYVEFDKNTLSLNLLNNNDSVIKTVVLNPNDKKFLMIDPLAEKYYSWSPYAYCVNNPLRFIDPNGMDWYSYEEKYKDKNGEEQTRMRYKYFDHALSDEKMKKGGYTHLGKTYTDGNNYYSLFGHKKDLRTQEGQIYQVIDNAIIAYGHNKEINNLYNPNRDPFDSESHRLYGTNMSLTTRLTGTIEYEGSTSGFYNQYTGWGSSASRKAAMTGNVVNLFDGMYTNVNGAITKVPFQLYGGGFGNATTSSQWLLIWNGVTEVTDISTPITGFQYSKEQAKIMLEKFYKLFPYAK
ncbi:MAG: hypothetical protein LBC68_10485 [Prevotellaceae bacterium]|jgi:hypothetical protein|nr:hypothetical protein [Prevotellaceae bacterium]